MDLQDTTAAGNYGSGIGGDVQLLDQVMDSGTGCQFDAHAQIRIVAFHTIAQDTEEFYVYLHQFNALKIKRFIDIVRTDLNHYVMRRKRFFVKKARQSIIFPGKTGPAIEIPF